MTLQKEYLYAGIYHVIFVYTYDTHLTTSILRCHSVHKEGIHRGGIHRGGLLREGIQLTHYYIGTIKRFIEIAAELHACVYMYICTFFMEGRIRVLIGDRCGLSNNMP